ncbi:acyltransferase family protein [Listeria booriae]|uniref:acyltransferase family protein n=1 Tax=Listeria TaxID=1637 RepID=UPI00162398BB|nr:MULTISPECIES: acyltransferase family protein [Listeria]MBC1334710.1 acyltransferase family protein [Listeria booriae]MBC1435950.1 acyltransferase family protein [Listeria rocourtiae]MBC1943583.1 acyltransferase family protein [Listeria booriae]MBC6135898.1 acyltransferase family protein [Listeria booriae]MBC6166975.1 acyltransferase family protein [Listeria booriae]
MKRLAWIDTAKGIGIFLVVWGHFYASDTLKIVIYGFHMPLFFFLSGYLDKVREIRLLPFLKKKSKQLLLPFFIFQIVTFVIVNGLSFIGSKQLYAPMSTQFSQFFFLQGDVGFNTPLWFLVVLFSVEIVFYLCTRYIKKGQWLVIAILFVAAFLLSRNEGVRVIFGLQILPVSVLFYYVGFQWKVWQILERKSWNHWYIILLGVIAYLCTVFYLNAGQVVGFRSNNVGNFFIFVVGALLGIFIFCLICKKIGKSKIWELFGRNSLIIMGTHYFFLIFFANVWKFSTQETLSSAYPIWITLAMTLFAFCIYYICFRFIAVLHKRKS